MKKVLLLGGAGGVGRSLTTVLNADKYKIVSVGSKELDITNCDTKYNKYNDISVVVVLSGVIDRHSLGSPSLLTSRLINVNCLGAVNVLAGFLPVLQKPGRIIFMSSVFSEIDVKGYGVYSASKAFVDRLVRSAALEYAHLDITVNSIQLGYAGVGMGDGVDDTTKEKILSKIGAGRFVSPLEIARTIEYIIETPYLTGQNIRLDGGMR
jgi:NAD(P)-dependent dehydrogenase (short-subunit alcohol dehydrogenase family)